nr:hypothetical protein [Actinomycetota bacterium]
MTRTRKLVAALFSTAVMAVTVAAPASAHPPLFTGGLVNITIMDVLNENQISVQVPIGVAANVCGVQANVLAQANTQAPVDCTAATTQD